MSTQGENGYMLIFRSKEWYKGLPPEEMQHVVEKWMAWFKGLTESGKAVAGNPLEHQGKVISETGGRRTVSDGPFAESKETIGGYFVLRVSGMDEAVAIGNQCPGLPYGIVVEVRQIAGQCPIIDAVHTMKDEAVSAMA